MTSRCRTHVLSGKRTELGLNLSAKKNAGLTPYDIKIIYEEDAPWALKCCLIKEILFITQHGFNKIIICIGKRHIHFASVGH